MSRSSAVYVSSPVRVRPADAIALRVASAVAWPKASLPASIAILVALRSLKNSTTRAAIESLVGTTWKRYGNFCGSFNAEEPA